MSPDGAAPTRVPAGGQPSLNERLEWLRLRAASERLTFALARQDLQDRVAKLQHAAGWFRALVRTVLPRRSGTGAGGGFSWVPLATWLLPMLVSAAMRRSGGERGRRGGGRLGLGLLGAMLGMALLPLLRRAARRS